MTKNTSWDTTSIAVSREYDIFISYSRRDKDFVRQLWTKLVEHNQNIWIDWEDIPPAQDWRTEIYRGIEASNYFVFIISSHSVNSTVCGEELAYALKQGKRLIPLVREEVNPEKVHPELARLNWIFFHDDYRFDQGIQILITAIKTDINYIRKHTCLIIRAREWENSGYDKSFLIWGKELEQAEEWLIESRDKTPKPIELHLTYLNACRQAEQERKIVELRLRQMTQQDYRNRQALLNKVRNYWIDGVLKTSIQGKTLIPLEIEERSFLINLSEQILTPNLLLENTLINIFDRLGEGRTLLILGQPGAGKTTKLLELARKLIERAETGLDDRIPVIFNLSSWGIQRQPIDVWLVEELNTKYQVPKEIGQGWVKQQQLLLLLDGLDEVKTEYRQCCVDALNHFYQNYSPEIVICCRIEEYETLIHPLNFQKAIYLRSLSFGQVYSYLANGGDELRRLQGIIATDPDLQELVTSPLMLQLVILAYQGSDISELFHSALRKERLRQLLETYVERMLERRGANSRYTKAQVKYWLSWLAKNMNQSSQIIFFIEQMQGNLLTHDSQKKYYKLINILSIIILILIMIIIGYGSLWSLFFKICYGFIIGIIIAIIILRESEKINLHETLQWSWKKAISSFKKALVYGIIGIISYGIVSGIVNWGLGLVLNPDHSKGIFQEILSGFGWGLVGMLIFCPIYTLVGGLRGPEIETKSIPNQGIWKTLLNAGIGALIGVLVGLLMGGIVFGLFNQLHIGLTFGVTFGLIFGFLTGGGTSCIQHLTLRFILWKNGYIPWNYAQFLDYTTDCVILRKVGGGYMFIHRFLLEYFANLNLK
ncbi:putative signal transduction protein with Nacht domain protein [Gloeothece citriformis PCC 7424]|uniref:Putative signal transduction protein with Nacht domain protein n=1 Tax=Gloeothece citriformis (strain PCC 7424) TaxID=65393 RepID=B7K9I0_GLOC7|nr:TIR domain-containing protein [Gloeothece citriformis]ACK69948.1 putative signal transduction protein with Nacht domain protein [Gloeothece citriformis PCC 7424]